MIMGMGISVASSLCRRLNLSHLLILICVIVFRPFVGPATATATTGNNNNKRASNKGSQKVSGFITCSNSSISLLTTRRHAKVRKICRARYRLWSDLNHRWDLGFQIPYTIYQIPRFQNPKWVLLFSYSGRGRDAGNVISKLLVLFRRFQKAI